MGYSDGGTQYIVRYVTEVRVENIFTEWVEITTSVEYAIAKGKHDKKKIGSRAKHPLTSRQNTQEKQQGGQKKNTEGRSEKLEKNRK